MNIMNGELHKATVICGAPCVTIDKTLIQGMIIAADKGLDHALKAGITPDLVVGDFDSAESKVPDSSAIIKVPSEKDDTDTIIAADSAIGSGCNDINFLCSLGGRVDHSFANIQMLEYLYKRGVKGRLFGENEAACLLHSGESIKVPYFKGYISIFSYTDIAKVSGEGLKYPINGLEIDNAYPIGVSNEIADENGAVITVKKGTLLLLFVKNT